MSEYVPEPPGDDEPVTEPLSPMEYAELAAGRLKIDFTMSIEGMLKGLAEVRAMVEPYAVMVDVLDALESDWTLASTAAVQAFDHLEHLFEATQQD